MTAYDASEWTDLFVASAGAGAALAGLVFVAVSINIDRILKFEGLADRALATVLLLLVVVVVSITGLIPGQSQSSLGIEVLVIGLIFGGLITRLSIQSVPDVSEHLDWLAGRMVVAVIGTVPFMIGGVSLLASGGGGLYWVAGGIVGGIAGAVATAWVLLVEILR